MRWKLIPGFRLLRRRTVWWPTWLGWCVIIASLVVPAVWWTLEGESFLSLTDRLPAEVLVVEGWIGRNGVRAAATEFEQRGYEYIVTSGGPSEGWEEDPLSYAEMAHRELIRSGIPKERIIVAPSKSTQTGRTCEAALAVSDALQRRNIKPKAFNIFTRGSHARRSRLVFAKVEAIADESRGHRVDSNRHRFRSMVAVLRTH